ncbi:Exo-beta-D-glucosaminidase [Pedobacter glucosidilyticus]|nr:glycoside hydrolase family 2 TIM barrel-domain containing protein [Pedobacter glucosidilyticus]KHJ36557.1 Exo-beta-D-glucosaminidase [Pedobacter glucosidilyticus]
MNHYSTKRMLWSGFKKTALTSLLILGATQLNAQQYKLNYGLSQPQDPATLPKSKAAVVLPVKKEKVEAKTILKPLANDELQITGGWEMIQASAVQASGEYISTAAVNTKSWYNATVPGTVLTTLVDQGVYPDPYFGLNNMHIPEDLCRQNWWYRTSFKTPVLNDKKQLWLVFNGINYHADIWMNGHLLGKMSGAFKTATYDISKHLNPKGENVVAVRIIPPQNPGIPHEESATAGRGPNGGLLAVDGPTFISSEGWDWVPGIRDRNIGIWQDVRLKLSGPVVIQYPQVITDLPLPDTTKAAITVKTELYNSSKTAQKVTLTGKIENITFYKMVDLAAGERKIISFSPAEFAQLNLKNPRLWWPNGFGKQALYQLTLNAQVNGLSSDDKTTRFGIRELTYDMTVDFPQEKNKRVELNPITALKDGKAIFDNANRREVANNVTIPSLLPGINPAVLQNSKETSTAPFLVIKVNGQKIYCKGGNWGMDDAMKRVSRTQLEPYFRLHKDANFTMIRNWTGESTEEVFYELCDEYGMLVWNDFWLSTEGYNLEVNDEHLFVENARDVVKRFRNHPSIAIWCPRNEGYALPKLDFELATLIAKEDGTRHYHGNSRLMNLRASGPWDYEKDASVYFSKMADGFSTELGTPSVPTAASMRKMMAKEDVWPISDAWYYHDLHFGQNDYRRAIDSLYGPATNLEDFCKKAQMINYDSHRAMFEAWNSKLWQNTSGLLLWMTHPAWPSTVWQVYSWDFETFGSYFASQKACEPVHVQMNLHNDEVIVVNTSLNAYKDAKLHLNVYDLDGKQIHQQKATLQVLKNQLNNGFKAQLPANLPANYLVRLKLTDRNGKTLSDNDYWKNNGKETNFLAFNKLANVKLDIKINDKKTSETVKTYFTVSNPSATTAIAVKLNLKSCTTKEIILPAYFSDGYFNLLPGESRKVMVDYPIQNGEVEIAVDGYNIDSSKNIKIAAK